MTAFPDLSVPRLPCPLPPAEFRSSQAVRWCPGCGNHAILATAHAFLAGLRLPKENIVIVSGIGCSSRFPYYVDTYGIHSIHGRALPIATGISISRPDLSVWVVTGDGDALSIGGNHLVHALRRNVNVKVLLFNNGIYGLTKGQPSPTSEFGKITKSTPYGTLEHPFNPVSLALGAEATFVARSIDSDRRHLTATLEAAAAHEGAGLVEIYQNCPVFNDDAHEPLRRSQDRHDRTIRLEHGRPIVFGRQSHRAVVRDPVTGALGIGDATDPRVVVHDTHSADLSYAFALSRLAEPDLRHTPIGVFRAVPGTSYDRRFRERLTARTGIAADVQALLRGTDGWTVA